ncbi:lysozyme-like [Cydia splendana]|uniref:lysozyme-like n=1 Tax=Cydia splendana TaxID=1100963 RepID=UPI0021404BD5
MRRFIKVLFPFIGVMLGFYCITGSTGLYISNLSQACYRCLCHVATGCDVSHGCTAGYCGPFNISRVYWIDAGKVTLPEDDPERNHAWEDCARSYHCASRIVEGYLQKFGKDCNSDGVTNCFDYMMINGNGGYGCTAPLNRSANGRRWLRRFQDCALNL